MDPFYEDDTTVWGINDTLDSFEGEESALVVDEAGNLLEVPLEDIEEEEDFDEHESFIKDLFPNKPILGGVLDGAGKLAGGLIGRNKGGSTSPQPKPTVIVNQEPAPPKPEKSKLPMILGIVGAAVVVLTLVIVLIKK